MLFSAVGTAKYQHIYHLETTREVWTRLASHHEGTATVKARLFQTHRRKYENFVQKADESVEEMFGHFQSTINKLRANMCTTDHLPTDHEQALKLLHRLDPKV